MSNRSNDSGGCAGWFKWLVGVVVALLAAGGSIVAILNYINNQKPESTRLATQYFMDNDPSRVIDVAYLGDNLYSISSLTDPYPWECIANATLNGDTLSCSLAKFRNSQATMKVEGILQTDRTIQITFRFIKDDNGNPTDRIDYGHIWYPQH